jgi:hypothetical protein
VLVAGGGQERLDTRHPADQPRRHAKVTVSGRHPRNVELHRPQQNGVRADQGQRLRVDLENLDDVDDRAAAPLDLGPRLLEVRHATRLPMRMSACSTMRSMPPYASMTT